MFVPSAVLAVIAAVLPPFASPDEVKMKDGKEYKNVKLVKETPTHYTFEDLDGKKITIAKDSVEKYEKKPTIRDELKDRVAKAGADAKALIEIAAWAKAQGIPRDAKIAYEAAIKADPENEEARAALDYVKHEGAWVQKKDIEAKVEKEKGERLKPLGYKEEKGKWISPADAGRKAAGVVQVGKYWVTPDQKKTIEAKKLEYREGDWLTEEEVVKFDKEQLRKVKGQWKPILDADEAHRDVKDPWVLKGVYVQLVSTVRYSKIVLGFRAADDAVNAAVALSGVEPEVYKQDLLQVVVEKDLEGYKAAVARSGTDWSSLRGNDDGVVYSPKWNKDRGASVTYYHDDTFIRWWCGRGAFDAYVGRLNDITRLDAPLLEAFGAYFGCFVGEKYSPVAAQNFLFDRSKVMKAASKMFEGYSRKDTYTVAQSGFLIHFLVKKNRDATALAFQRFLAGNLRASELVETVLGKVAPAELDKEYEETWVKFRDNFRP
jgi:hypothetical protein